MDTLLFLAVGLLFVEPFICLHFVMTSIFLRFPFVAVNFYSVAPKTDINKHLISLWFDVDYKFYFYNSKFLHLSIFIQQSFSFLNGMLIFAFADCVSFEILLIFLGFFLFFLLFCQLLGVSTLAGTWMGTENTWAIYLILEAAE